MKHVVLQADDMFVSWAAAPCYGELVSASRKGAEIFFHTDFSLSLLRLLSLQHAGPRRISAVKIVDKTKYCRDHVGHCLY